MYDSDLNYDVFKPTYLYSYYNHKATSVFNKFRPIVPIFLRICAIYLTPLFSVQNRRYNYSTFENVKKLTKSGLMRSSIRPPVNKTIKDNRSVNQLLVNTVFYKYIEHSLTLRITSHARLAHHCLLHTGLSLQPSHCRPCRQKALSWL